MRNLVTRSLAVGVAAALAFSATACGSDDDDAAADGAGEAGADSETVKLGVLVEQTGPVQQLGVSTLAGVQLAVDRINEEGFEVDGKTYRFEVVAEDTKSDPAAASAAAVQLIQDEGVKFIFGTASTPGVRAVLPITRESEVIQIAACGGCEAAGLMGADDTEFFFRTFASSAAKLGGIVSAIREYSPDTETIAILDPDINKPLTDVLAEDLRGLGYDVPDPVYFPAGTTDFSSYITRIKSSNPDVIYGSQSDTEVETQIQQVIQQDAAPVFLGLENSPGLAEDPPLSIPTLLVYTHPSLALPATPEIEAFVEEAWPGGSGEPEQPDYVTFVYDYVFMLAQAMGEAGTVTDTAAIRDALEGTTYEGVIGQLAFDDAHQVVLGGQIAEVVDGEASTKLLTPEELEVGS